jgi:DNA damage-binding protein 2
MADVLKSQAAYSHPPTISAPPNNALHDKASKMIEWKFGGTEMLWGPAQDNIVVSGDKKGQVAVWDFEKVHERTVHGSMHRALTNNLRFLGPLHDMQCASASSDGLCKVGLPCHSSVNQAPPVVR